MLTAGAERVLAAIAIIGAAALAGAGCAALRGESVGGAAWGYAGVAGPERWGELSDEYALCALGTAQSPVNITDYAASDGDPLEFGYRPDAERVSNVGTFARVNYRGESRLRAGGAEYGLHDAHIHYPSEHALDGRLSAAEMHLVHMGEGGEIAVVGLMFDVGDDANPFIENLLGALPAAGEEAELTDGATADGAAVAGLNVAATLPKARGYYAYTGSLTTPPCSEGVRWFVMAEIGAMSQAQLDSLKRLTGGDANNRPLQPLNGRPIAAIGCCCGAGTLRQCADDDAL